MIKIIYTSSVEFYNILLNKHCNRYYLRCILRIEHISLHAIRREWVTVVLIHIRKSLSLEILVPFLKFALFTTLKWNVWLLVWWNIKTSNDPQSVFIFWLFLWQNGLYKNILSNGRYDNNRQSRNTMINRFWISFEDIYSRNLCFDYFANAWSLDRGHLSTFAP